jgi:RNA 2',3'-cyclic 3'-phosphodiesterase
MRLFVALDLPDTILNTLSQLTSRLRPLARVQWSPVSNLHITTKFIGDWPEERLDELKSALSAVPAVGLIEVKVEGLGWFPNPESPRVFWAGVGDNQSIPESLQHLARQTDQATGVLGVPLETRAFHPHLTLARIRQAVDLVPLRQAVAKLDPADFGAFTARSQFLYQTKLDPSGSVYTKLAEFPFS